MASQKVTYPILPEKWWWALRTRCKQSIPSFIKTPYVSAVLNIGQDTAAKIALPAFRKVGLIDKLGKPTERAIRWRDDLQYPDVCREILQEIYPQELLDTIPDPHRDRATAERWFANVTGSGQSAVTKMTSFYQLLLEADPDKSKEVEKRQDIEGISKEQSTRSSISKPSSGTTSRRSIRPQSTKEQVNPFAGNSSGLELLLRILPPEGTPLPAWRREQWLSMARETLAYLYPEENPSNKSDE